MIGRVERRTVRVGELELELWLEGGVLETSLGDPEADRMARRLTGEVETCDLLFARVLKRMIERAPDPEAELERLLDEYGRMQEEAAGGVQRPAEFLNHPLFMIHLVASERGGPDVSYAARQVGYSPQLPPEVAEWMAEHNRGWWSLLENPAVELGLRLRILERQSRVPARRHAARNPNWPPELLHEFSLEEDLEVRTAVTANPSLALADRERMADSRLTSLRVALAGNPSLTEPEQMRLCGHRYHAVRRSLVHNPSLSERVLRALARDKDPLTRQAAEARLRQLGIKQPAAAERPELLELEI